jgi:hypothetical protein
VFRHLAPFGVGFGALILIEVFIQYRVALAHSSGSARRIMTAGTRCAAQRGADTFHIRDEIFRSECQETSPVGLRSKQA